MCACIATSSGPSWNDNRASTHQEIVDLTGNANFYFPVQDNRSQYHLYSIHTVISNLFNKTEARMEEFIFWVRGFKSGTQFWLLLWKTFLSLRQIQRQSISFGYGCLHLCPSQVTDFLIIHNNITLFNKSIFNKLEFNTRKNSQTKTQTKPKNINMDYNFPMLTFCFKLSGLAIYLLYVLGVLYGTRGGAVG